MSLRANVIANFAGQGWNALMGLAFLPLYIKYLGLEAYGLLGFYALIQGWMAVLDFGTTSTLSREMALYRGGARTPKEIADLLRSLEVLSSLICVALAITIYMTSGWLAVNWLNLKTIDRAVAAQAISLMGVIVGCRLIEGLYRGAIIGLQEQVWLNVVGAIFATARWGGAVLVLWGVESSIQAYFYWQLIVSLLVTAVLAIRTHSAARYGQVKPQLSKDALRSVARFAVGVSTSTLLAILLTQVDKLMLSKMLDLDDFGRYMFAATLTGAMLQLVIPLSHAFYPRFSQLYAHGDLQKLAATYHGGTQLAHLILIPAATTVSAFALPLITAWSGSADLASRSANLVSVLAIGTMLNGAMQIPYAITLAYGWSGFSVRLNAVAVLLIVPALLWAVPNLGAIGAAWVWLFLNLGYVIAGVYFIHTKILPAERRRWYVRDLGIPGLAAVTVIILSAWILPQPSLVGIVVAYLLSIAAMALASSEIRPIVLRYIMRNDAHPREYTK